ncbi:MAG: hypothetical protein WCI38_01950 [Chthoniobacterales bacterium]|jgi:hypothetical protein
MDVEFVSDTRANVKHVYLGLSADDNCVKRLTCDVGTWEMDWAEREAMWIVDGWGPDESCFQVDFIKDRIPWKKIRGLFRASDEDCAQTIASNSRFEREFIEATAQLPADEDDIYSVIADPLLRQALKPADD